MEHTLFDPIFTYIFDITIQPKRILKPDVACFDFQNRKPVKHMKTHT